jgi:L-malate glycosyltransferase
MVVGDGECGRSRATICQVLHSLNVGGAEILAYRLAGQLGGQYRFVFACLDEVGSLGAELRAQGMPIEALGRGTGLDMDCARRLAGFLRREKVDLIHAHQYTPFAYSLLAGWLRRRPPVLFNEHGRFHPDHRSFKRVIFNRLMLRRRDRVIAVGQAVRKAVIDNEGISPRRIGVIHNGVRLPVERAEPAVRLAVRHELGVSEDEFLILLVARLDAIKDHATAIRALARVTATAPRTRLLIVGDGAERDQIQREIEARGLVRWVGMLGQRRDVDRLLGAADAILLTSLSEGIPVTIIEAMGYGLPVVATDVGGVREVVENGRTGLLASAGGDEELAQAILRLVSDVPLRREMGQAGRRRAEALFTEDRMHRAYAAVYEEMLRE